MAKKYFKFTKIKIRHVIALGVLFLFILIYISSTEILTSIGKFIVVDEEPIKSDAIVVLNTGIEYYPRLIQAADLYRTGYADKIVINGNRKTDTLRELEKMGFKYCCAWYEESSRILELFGVNRKDIIAISAEDVYDTISETKMIGNQLLRYNLKSVIVITSKFHTRRARHIWQKNWSKKLEIITIAAKRDPYSPDGWWKSGRHIKWVMSEYGAWLYYFWKSMGS